MSKEEIESPRKVKYVCGSCGQVHYDEKYNPKVDTEISGGAN